MRRIGFAAVIAAAALSTGGAVARGAHHRSAVAFRREHGGVEISLGQTGSGSTCEPGASFGRVSIGDRRNKLILLTEDICEPESWRRIVCQGESCRRSRCQAEGCGMLSGIPGFGVYTWVRTTGTRAGSRVNVEANGDNATRGYRIVVRTKDERQVGWLVIDRERFWHYERIYEGTDAFVNFCIDREQEIRSFGGSLYCTRESPVTGPNFVEFHRP
jgi:hypothetical protein